MPKPHTLQSLILFLSSLALGLQIHTGQRRPVLISFVPLISFSTSHGHRSRRRRRSPASQPCRHGSASQAAGRRLRLRRGGRLPVWVVVGRAAAAGAPAHQGGRLAHRARRRRLGPPRAVQPITGGGAGQYTYISFSMRADHVYATAFLSISFSFCFRSC